MEPKELIVKTPQQVTQYMIYCIVRGVVATIGKSDSLPQDELNNMVTRIVSTQILNKQRTDMNASRG